MFAPTQSYRWLGTPDVMAFVAGVGLIAGVVCGFVVGFGPNAGPVFAGLLFAIPGMLFGLGLGAFLYRPRWAISGFLIAATLIPALLLISILVGGNNNPPQQGRADNWIELTAVVFFFGISGAGLGGLFKLLLDEAGLERRRIAESQRIDKIRYCSYLKRRARNQYRLSHPRTEPLSIAMLAFLQVQFAFIPPPIAWVVLALMVTYWLAGRRLTISGYRRWRKYATIRRQEEAEPTAPGFDADANTPPCQEPYPVFDSKRDFQQKAVNLAFLCLVAMPFLGFTPQGWIMAICMPVFLVPPVINAYRFWRKEERIALGE